MGIMKKKFTRKVRKNKRSTQRRKNRSYKRMRGGKFEFQTRKQIVNLLTNLIINNVNEETKKELCPPPPPPTAEQPLLPRAGQPILLKNVNGVNKVLIDMYKTIIDHDTKGEYKYTFSNDNTTSSIIKELHTKKISYFDISVEKTETVPILSPDEFDSSLTSSLQLKGFFIKDALVQSMFALAQKCITLIPLLDRKAKANININDTECPPIAHI